MPKRPASKTAKSAARSRARPDSEQISLNGEAAPRRPRGRPRTEIDLDVVADAVAGLFVEGGMDAVSIVSVAKRLDVSRATLYRTVPTKEHLLGLLFERSTRELTDMVKAVLADDISVEQKLTRLIELQVDAAVRMRRYMPVFFGGSGLPSDVFKRWHSWSRKFELMWTDCVSDAIDEGVLDQADPVIATRLILGQCIWVSRWYRPNEGIDTSEISAAAVALVIPRKSARRPRKSARSG